MPDNLLVIDPPNEKQQQFFRAKSRFVAYGGARGGGKSTMTEGSINASKEDIDSFFNAL